MGRDNLNLCLSGNSSERYRRDILRALALPRGAHLQFRYDSKWVSSAIWQNLSGAFEKPRRALIAFWNTEDKGMPPTFLPCRFGSVVSARRLGSIATLTLELEDFAYAGDLSEFNQEVRRLSKGLLPVWAESGKIAGELWSALEADPVGVRRISQATEWVGDWQQIVAQLAPLASFAPEPTFYVVLGVCEAARESWVEPKDGVYPLCPNRDYELQLHHFHPGSDFGPAHGNVELSLVVHGEGANLTSNPTVLLDSPYDLKRWRFKTGEPMRTERFVLSAYRKEPNPGPQTQSMNLEFDLVFSVGRNLLKRVCWGLAIALLLAFPHVLHVLDDPRGFSLWPIILVFVTCGACGYLAAFKLGRPI